MFPMDLRSDSFHRQEGGGNYSELNECLFPDPRPAVNVNLTVIEYRGFTKRCEKHKQL